MDSIILPPTIYEDTCKAAIQGGDILQAYVDRFRKLKEDDPAKYERKLQKFSDFKDKKKELANRTDENKKLNRLTTADKHLHRFLLGALAAILPFVPLSENGRFAGFSNIPVPIISEENPKGENQRILDSKPRVYWVIDGLDGTDTYYSYITKPYKDGYNQYSVNISLVVDGVPTLGFLYFPALGQLYFTGAERSHYANTTPITKFESSVSDITVEGKVIPKALVSKQVICPEALANSFVVNNKRFFVSDIPVPSPKDFGERFLGPLTIATGFGRQIDKSLANAFSPKNMQFSWVPQPLAQHLGEGYDFQAKCWRPLYDERRKTFIPVLGMPPMSLEAPPGKHNFFLNDAMQPNAGRYRDMAVLMKDKDLATNGELMIWDFAASNAIISKAPGYRMLATDEFLRILSEGAQPEKTIESSVFNYGSLNKLPPNVILHEHMLSMLIEASKKAKLSPPPSEESLGNDGDTNFVATYIRKHQMDFPELLYKLITGNEVKR